MTGVQTCALPIYHTVEVTGGFLEEECACLLRDFFKTLRTRLKKRRGVDYALPKK